ncbi:9082_t:CDS:2 [Ambispora leptoticha]|uniref:9082_t:CDS:1 n=1 Tax=Ambispora leptoticha TaxID=144679 RepID=A0A9N8W5T4_9GLOM|nr:9082_t:CDS:2 [Ambispora leptoticha]
MKDTQIFKKIAVNVKVNEETPILLKLPLNAKLSDIRLILNNEPEIRMNNKMSFLGQSNKIDKDKETELLLSEILIKNNLNIIGEIEPDWMTTMTEICALGYGLHFTEKGPFPAKEKAFSIMRLIPEILPHPFTDEEIVVCKNEEENLCVRNLISNSNITDKSSSIFENVRSQYSTAETCKDDDIYSKFKRLIATLTIKESDIKPTKNFENAVDEALASHNKRESLRKATDDFGQFWCKKYEIGGVILSKMSNSSPTSESFFKIHGVLEETYRTEGISEWFNSLKDYKTWGIAEYLDICSIFDILDKDRRTKISLAMGKTIHHSQVLKFNPIFNLADRRPVLGYIVVGKSPSNLFEQKSEQLTLESSEIPLIVTKDRCSAIIKEQTRNPSTALIATCVTKSKNRQSDPKDSEFIIGAHFNIKNNTIEACVFCYDRKMNPYHQFNSLSDNLFLDRCIISEQQNLLSGQAQIIERDFTRFLFASKKSKIAFDNYPRIISTSYTNSNDESAQGFQNPVFLNLITTNCEEEGVHGFFKICDL